MNPSSPSAEAARRYDIDWLRVCATYLLFVFHVAMVTRRSAALPYLTESAFPVYILHQPAIVFIGYGLIQLPLGVAAKFNLLLAAAVLSTLAVYHFVVRPFAVPRFLFGMKPRVQRALSLPALAPTTAVAVLAGVFLTQPARAATPVGLWYAEGGAAQVELAPCGQGLCGRVVWLRSPFDEDGCDQRDRHNPNPALRGRPLIGIQILSGLEASPDDHAWSGGMIYDPTSGNTYRCTLQLEGENRLRLRGYIGVPLLGRTTTWTRVGSENQMCQR